MKFLTYRSGVRPPGQAAHFWSDIGRIEPARPCLLLTPGRMVHHPNPTTPGRILALGWVRASPATRTMSSQAAESSAAIWTPSFGKRFCATRTRVGRIDRRHLPRRTRPSCAGSACVWATTGRRDRSMPERPAAKVCNDLDCRCACHLGGPSSAGWSRPWKC
jgi:hypothetical protein